MLKAQVDDIETIDEGLRDFYEQANEGEPWRLKVEGLEPPEDVSGLKKALDAERTRAKEQEKRAKELERLNQETERKQLEKQGEYQELYNKSQERLTELEKSIQERDQKAAETSRKTMAKDLSVELANDPAQARLLTYEIERLIETREGEQVYTLNGLVVDKKAVEEYIKSEFPSAVKGSGASGGGGQGGNNRMPAPVSKEREVAIKDAIKKNDVKALRKAHSTGK